MAGSAYDKLKPQRQAFVDFYVNGGGDPEKIGNGAHAAIAAGYSERTARQTASRLLAKADIKKAMKERQAEHKERHNGITDKLMSKAERVYGCCMGDETITEQFDPTNALKAIDTQAKLVGAYAPEKQDVKITHEESLAELGDLDDWHKGGVK